MHEPKQETAAKTNFHHLQPTAEQQPEALASQETLSPQQNPLVREINRVGNTPSASIHATMLNRSTASQNGAFLRQLQRQYGNSYVQRVLALSRKADGEAEAAPEVEEAIQRNRGNGQSLDGKVQAQMASAFGVDFGGVRVHTDTEADTLNRVLDARAFTTGQDIFFRQGEYNPNSSSGRELLAHELTHVVQQTGGIQPKLTISSPGDAYEQEADHVAAKIVKMASLTSQPEQLTQTQVERGAMKISGLLQRDEKDEQLLANDSSKAPVAPPTTAPVSPSTAPIAENRVATNWELDYRNIPLDATQPKKEKPKTRSANSALYVESFRVHPIIDPPLPAGAPKVSDGIFNGIATAASGAVKLGTYMHPKGYSGEVSAAVKFGNQPIVKVDLKMETLLAPKDPDYKDKKAKFDLDKKTIDTDVKNYIKTLSELNDTQQLQDSIKNWMKSGKYASYATESQVSITEGVTAKTTSYGLGTLAYGPVPEMGKTYKMEIEVPVEVREKDKNIKSGSEKSVTKGTSEGEKVAKENGSRITEGEVKTDVSTWKKTFTDAVKEAWEKHQTDAKASKKAETKSSTIKVGAGAKYSISPKIGGELPLKVKGFEIAKAIIEIASDFGLDLTLGYERNSVENKETSSTLTEEEKKNWEQAITKATEEYVSKTVETKVEREYSEKYQVEKTSGLTYQEADKKNYESASTSVELIYLPQDPVLTFKKDGK